MIIQVNGHVFDTTQIYRITPVSEKQEYGYDVASFDFQIFFLNSDKFINIISLKERTPRDKFVELHTKIIDLWNEDKHEIPNFSV